MKPAIPILIIAFMSIYGCSADDSLQGAYERQIKENGMDGFNIIHLEERASVGLVLNTSWTNDYPENQFRPGIHVFEKTEGGWQAVPGTACDANTVARLSLFGTVSSTAPASIRNRKFRKSVSANLQPRFSIQPTARVSGLRLRRNAMPKP